MRLLFFVCIYALFPVSIFCQSYDLSGMQGLRNKNGEVNLELSGYDIYIGTIKGKVSDEKKIKSIKKKHKLEKISSEYSSSDYNIQNKIIEVEQQDVKDRPKVKSNLICYLFQESDQEITIILLQTLNKRDIALEKEVLDEYFKTGLADYILYDREASSISFAGRQIELGTACQWMSPHNVNCKGGQISWAEFSSFDAAMVDINTRIDANVNDQLMILSEDDLDVIFEGIPSLAHRVAYMHSRESYPLIVYYIVQEVRGRFVSCTLSNYGYNRNDYELAPLLEEVMSIPEVPETAYKTFDKPDFENVEFNEDEKEDEINFWGVQLGSWIPIGGLKNILGVSPSVQGYIGYPIKENMAIDIGANIIIPINTKRFDYYYENSVYSVKTDMLVGVFLKWRHQQKVANNIFLTKYIGLGFHSLQTNLKKEDYDNDSDDTWHSVETFDLFGGLSIRHKKIGCFVEYHFTPYSIGGKMRKEMGNSALNLGVSLSF